MNYPLLLTGTIDSSVYLNTGNIITNANQRLEQYESSLYRYITETPFNKIVFIENSGFDFDREKYELIAKKHDKSFEFISGTVCKDEIIKHGKSYGDAYLIWEGINTSRLLTTEAFFYKMTGRIFLENADVMVKTVNKHRNEFILYPGIGWCLTYFFRANKEDYLRVLGDVYNDCDELSVNDIEISFYNRLTKSDLDIGCFDAFPQIDGIMGATGKPYTETGIKKALLDFAARIGIFSNYGPNSKLFWSMYRLIKGNGYRKDIE